MSYSILFKYTLILQQQAVSSVSFIDDGGTTLDQSAVTQCNLYSFKFLYNEFLTMRNRISVALQKLTEYSRSESVNSKNILEI